MWGFGQNLVIGGFVGRVFVRGVFVTRGVCHGIHQTWYLIRFCHPSYDNARTSHKIQLPEHVAYRNMFTLYSLCKLVYARLK